MSLDHYPVCIQSCSTINIPTMLRKGLLFLTLNTFLLDTGHKLNVHKSFRERPGRYLNVLYTFNLKCPNSK